MLHRLLINTSSNFLLLFVKLVLTFIMTPIFVRNMGDYDYGLWSILGSLVGYMSLLDIGIRPAITRYVAKYNAENNEKALHTMFTSGISFTFIVGLFGALILGSIGVFYPELVAPEGGGDTTPYTLVLIIIAIQLLVTFIGNVPESFLEGSHKYFLKNNISIVNSIVGASVLIYYMTPTNALYLLALVNLVGIMTKYIIYFVIVSAKRNGAYSFNFCDFSFSEIKRLLTFGGKSFVQGAAYQVSTASDGLVIGAFMGPAVLPFYSLPSSLISYISKLGFTLTGAFLPQFSELYALKRKQDIVTLHLKASKMIIAFILPVSIIFIVFGGVFISIWIDPKYVENSQLLILVLVLTILLPFLDPCKTRYLTAINKHGVLSKFFTISAIINIVLSLILVQFMGVIGVALGSLIPVVIFTPYYLYFACKSLGITVAFYVKKVLVPQILPNAFLVINSILLTSFVDISNYLMLSSVVSFICLIHLLLFWLYTLNTTEKLFIRNRCGQFL